MASFVILVGVLALFTFLILTINPRMSRFTRNFSRKKTLLFAGIAFVVMIVGGIISPDAKEGVKDGVNGTTASADASEKETAAPTKDADKPTATESVIRLTDEQKKAAADKKAAEEAAAKKKADAEAAAKKKAEAEAMKKAEEAKIPKIGDTYQVGDDLFRVNTVSIKKSIGNDFLSTKADGRFLVVNLSVKNGEKEAINMDASYFKLLRSDVEYSPVTVLTMDDSIIFEQINPGVTIHGNVVFDIPEDVATAGDLMLNVQTGFWGTEQGQIALKKKAAQ